MIREKMIQHHTIFLIALVVIFAYVALGLFFIGAFYKKQINVTSSDQNPPLRIIQIEEGENIPKNVSPISGLECLDYNRRPIAVILANDPVTRPLSGLSEADLVVEMSVITNEITRLMAVYVCGSTQEIGSLRSARHDFIPLAMGLDAILAHWGGSHYALDQLDTGIMDHLDAMANLFNAFYRKNGVPMPHDGFTSIERLTSSAKKIGYRLTSNLESYLHDYQKYNTDKMVQKSLYVDYPYPYNVKYDYQPADNLYWRFRAGQPEIDKLTGQQIAAANVVVMRAASRQIEGPYYNDVDVEGQGDCQIYQNGQVISGSWFKDSKDPSSKLLFYDEQGAEIKFVPGQIWLNIVEPGQNIKWL